MEPPEQARARLHRFLLIHAAFTRGDYAALAAALGSSPRWFDEQFPPDLILDRPLALAIQLSPTALIEALLIAGANPDTPIPPGLTPLFAAIGEPRPDRLDVIRLLLVYGADPNGRGVHNWTPLHHAVAHRNRSAVVVLLAAGADPSLNELIDLPSTPLDAARVSGFGEGIALLEAALDH